jgi:hypothetical protein
MVTRPRLGGDEVDSDEGRLDDLISGDDADVGGIKMAIEAMRQPKT